MGIYVTHEMNRLKALYRGWGIPCAGTQVYAARAREEWLNKLPQAGVRRRAELLYQQLDGLQDLRREVRPEFLAESRKHKAAKLLRQIPCIGPIRAARLIGLMQTPHRFRSKRQLAINPPDSLISGCAALCVCRLPRATRDYPRTILLGTIWQGSPYLSLTLAGNL